MAVMSVLHRQPGALWFGLEGVENLGADGPRPGAPGTLCRRRARSQRFNDQRLGIRIDRDAVLAHALIVFLQPGRESEPQFALGLTAGGINRGSRVRAQTVIGRLI